MHDPGDVVIVNFAGAVRVKRRPAVVLSSELYHAHRPDTILGLITSQTSAAIEPTDYVLLDWATAGLKQPSAFRSYIPTMPDGEVLARIGRLSDDDWLEVRKRVKVAFADLDEPQ